MMQEKYEQPPGPPPSYRATPQVTLDRPQQQHDARQPQRTSWTPGGGPGSPSHDLGTNNPYRNESLNAVAAQSSRASTISVPPGAGRAFQTPPPPSHGSAQGGPSSAQTSDTEMGDDDFEPPPGPPPGYKTAEMQYEPPPGPPPGHDPGAGTRSPEPPPYDPWTGPDDSLHPPPSFAAVRPETLKSPTANADYDDARRAHAWCRGYPLWPAVEHERHVVERIHAGDIRLTVPPTTTEVTQYQPAMGRSYVRTTSTIGDTIFLSDIPVYASLAQSPMSTGHPQTLYFEVHVMGLGDRYNPNNIVESGIAIGFLAPPYPAWRLPGWHRGSLGVHSDDGRRYVDNSYGGEDFTAPFHKGDVVGIGMTFAPPVHGDRVSSRCEVFFTRNGKIDGKWDLHEERDMNAEGGNIEGLEGYYDLLAAVGVFGSVELECVFRREEWMFQP